jgi:transcriptional regulator with XRE-family HTH domain
MLAGVPDTADLGRFLRSRRERLQPADVGLPNTGRRRTPGLRREEVAALAGLSIDYLVRLEQGRDHNPSAAVVRALADALRLDDDERLHLKKLAACAGSPDGCPLGSGDVDTVPPTVRRLLDQLGRTPAVVVGPWFQVVAYNVAWDRVVGPIGLLDGDAPNLARFTFLDPRAKAVFPSWAETADDQVAVLRDALVRWRTDDRMRAFIDELQAVPEFTVRWHQHDVARKRRGTKTVVHPVDGVLHVDYEVLLLPDESDQRLIAWLAADAATAEVFDRRGGPVERRSPAQLRVVSA